MKEKNNIIKRHFRILVDFPAVHNFMLRVYQKNCHNGEAAPFLEYALSASWADQTFTHHNAIWEDNGKIVAFCYYESEPGCAFFNLDPEYSFLAGDMIDHAESQLCGKNGKVKLQLFEGQNAIIEEAEKRGYKVTDIQDDKLFDLSKPLEYALPDGYRFVDYDEKNLDKLMECSWKGFDHEIEEGPWDGDIEFGLRVQAAPHATPWFYVIIEHIESGDYVCYAGMWWVPENKLAYMEPLCTVPLHRKKGLAAAALSKMAKQMRSLGAEWMTGGDSEFYTSIGYESGIKWLSYEK